MKEFWRPVVYGCVFVFLSDQKENVKDLDEFQRSK